MPETSVSYNGYRENVLTFDSNLSSVGFLAMLANDGVAVQCIDNSDFIGVAVSNDGNHAGIQTDGYVEIPYTGDPPLHGYCALVSDGKNNVKISTTSKHIVRVIKVDKDKKIVGILL